ncbi:MAG TPA: hypothetical protein VFK80_00230 [Limnochordia bacterium]|nr:hypothetical protein [Limnochordia bacterium]
MTTAVVYLNGRGYSAEVIRQDGDVIDARSLGGGFTTVHNVLPEGMARDGEPFYRPDTIREIEPEPPKPKRQPYPKGDDIKA